MKKDKQRKAENKCDEAEEEIAESLAVTMATSSDMDESSPPK